MTKKEEFIEKWSHWWLSQKNITDAFTSELNEVIQEAKQSYEEFFNRRKERKFMDSVGPVYHPSRLDYFTAAALTGILANGTWAVNTQETRRTVRDIVKETIKLLKQEEDED